MSDDNWTYFDFKLRFITVVVLILLGVQFYEWLVK